MQHIKSECPKCGRPLENFNGHIGHCSMHKWVSPLGLGFDAEAAEQNRRDAEAAEQSRLAKLRQEEEARIQNTAEQHRKNVRKGIAVAVALALIAGAAVFFFVRPGLNYGKAADRFAAGEYRAARDGYSALGKYRDSASRVVLCDAMIDLQEGRVEDAAAGLDQLTGDDQGEIAKQLADAIRPAVTDWEAKGISPQALLLLLGKADVIDPDGTLDIVKLSEEGHIALLDGTQRSVFTGDVDGDGETELVTLEADYSVTVYRMAADGNTRMAVDKDTLSACEMIFGSRYRDTDADASVACYSEAYRLSPNDETRAALASACQLRSNENENAGEMDAAIADAKSALEIAGTADAFAFFYDVNLRHCRNGHDAAAAIALWDEFAADSAIELTRYSAKERWQEDAAQLHLARAAELAAQQEEGCITEIRTAAEMGADTAAAIAEAEACFGPGMTLARLRLMEIELCGADDAKEQQIRAEMAGEVRTAIGEWKERLIAPCDVPALIRLAEEQGVDLSGYDRDAIYEEAAFASAGDPARYRFVDWDRDGYKELLTLDPAGMFALYGLDRTGKAFSSLDTKMPGAPCTIDDFSEAYRLSPNDGTRAALTSAYQLRSEENEDAGDMEAAVADARSAMETAGTADAFTFFYDINLRNCKNASDTAAAIGMWDAFAADSAAELTRYSAKERWQADAARLHIVRAAELAAQQEEGCITELRTAAEMGADVTGAMAEAASHFEPGLSLARLRLMEIDLLGTDAGKEQEIRANMADEVRTAISEWKSRGIPPADVPVLIHLADDQGIDLSGIDRDAIYEEAAVGSAGIVAQYTFVDWNADGYKELLTLDASGDLSLYGTNETWKVVSSMDTGLPGSSYTVADESAPLILVLSSGKDELLAVTGTGSRLNALFRETGISRYKAEGTAITFSRLLEGSIARYNEYAYEAAGTKNRPARTGIDWQQNDYPQPESAAAAIQRYFEARAYDIPGEAAILTEESDEALFSLARLDALPAPEAPGKVSAAAYRVEEERELFEVSYTSGARDVRTWIRTEYSSGWKLTGAADTYGEGLDPGGMDCGISLLGLNAETANTIPARGGVNTYRLLVPSSGRIRLQWQSGSKAVSRTSHTVTMLRGSLTGDTVFSFALQPSPNKQISKDLFVSAGVYYVTAEANTGDAEQYHLTIAYEQESHVELESNDTPAHATPMELDTGYSGSLSGPNDADHYSFTLDEASRVNIALGTVSTGNKTAAYTLRVFSAADGSSLSTVSVPGNTLLSETGSLYLSAGTYLVQITKGTVFADDEYTLTVHADRNGFMESEPNNTLETANAVPVNEDIHASIAKEGDVDCFAFTLDGDAVIQPKFTFAPTDSAAKTYVLTLLDAGGRELLRVNIGGKESTKVIAPAALMAGTYTVKIENPRFIRQEYTLRLTGMAVDRAEREPNDTAAFASDLTIGQPVTGVLPMDQDVDWYKVSFAGQTTVTLRLTFQQIASQKTAFVLTLQQNGETQWTANIKGDSGGTVQKLQFPAGEYYLRVKPLALLGIVYTLELE